MVVDMTGPEPELRTGSNDGVPDPFLKDFAKLGDQIYYIEPRSSFSKSQSTQDQTPELIILCAWLYALPKHIVKYTAVYKRLYPSTPILLLKQDGPDLMWRPNTWQMDNLKPAADVFMNLQAEGRKPRVLMHVFSNGGSFTACQLADAYAIHAQSRSNLSHLLPISALVIDSAPSIPTLRTGYTALAQGLPSSLPGPVRLVAGALIYGFMSGAAIAGKLVGTEGVISGMRRKLNDPQGPFMQNDVQRMYIYSESDELVPWQHVEMHADEAKRALQDRSAGSVSGLVRLEKFQGSKHVSHVMVDAERYWTSIQTLWTESVASIHD